MSRRVQRGWRKLAPGPFALRPRRADRGLAAGAAEREARDLAGMPWRHPEYLTRRLRRRHDRQLEALRAELWPDTEDVRES
jgi:hypothetical protein